MIKDFKEWWSLRTEAQQIGIVVLVLTAMLASYGIWEKVVQTFSEINLG